MKPYSQQSKLAAYRSVSAHGAVVEADPHTLVLRLFDAVFGRLMTARACIDNGETARKSAVPHNSVVLLAKLRGSLDIEKGNALMRNLSDLYEYMTCRPVHANLNTDSAAVGEVLGCSGKFGSPGPPLLRK